MEEQEELYMYLMVQGGMGLVEEQSGPTMSSSLWGGLPEELLEDVVKWLPVASLLRFRAVCKRWNRLLRCDAFLRHTWAPRCICLFGRGPGKGRIRRLSLAFLPHDCQQLVPRDSAGGLLCLTDAANSRMVVCNPVTRTWVEVPELGIIGIRQRSPRAVAHDLVRMQVDASTGSFSLLFYCHHRSTARSILVYTSGGGKWKQSMRDVPRRRRLIQDGLVYLGQLCCLNWGHAEAEVGWDCDCDCDCEESSRLCTNNTSAYLKQKRLVEVEGALFLAEVLHRPLELFLRLWRLDVSAFSWRHFAQLPGSHPRNLSSWSVASTDHHICFDICCNRTSPDSKSGLQQHTMISCNVATQAWHRREKYLVNHDPDQLNRSRTVLSFQPCLRYQSLAH